MLAGIFQLATKEGVFRVLRAVEHAVRISLLRFVPEDDHGFAAYVQSSVFVESLGLGGNSVAHEHQRHVEHTRTTDRKKGVILVQRQFDLGCALCTV